MSDSSPFLVYRLDLGLFGAELEQFIEEGAIVHHRLT